MYRHECAVHSRHAEKFTELENLLAKSEELILD
jgi:hypothetical protein